MKFFAIILVLLLTESVWAMQVNCDSVEENFSAADVVFVGTVLTRRALEVPPSICWTQKEGKSCGAKVVSVQLDLGLKGELADVMHVTAADACYCVDPYLEDSEKYIIFAKKTKNNSEYQSMNVCATVPFDQRLLDSITKQ